MFAQIIDLLVKQDDERRKLVFIALKFLFTSVLSAILYKRLFGHYSIILITDYNSLIDFLLHGRAIACLTLFYLVWSVSFTVPSFILSFVSTWISNKAYTAVEAFVDEPSLHWAELSKSKQTRWVVKFYMALLNANDVVEIKKGRVSTGSQFYKFYDYLTDVEDGKKKVGVREFSDTLALMTQFVMIYYFFDFHFLSAYWWLKGLYIITIIFLTLGSLVAHVLGTLVDIKHSRLLKLMEKIDPDYKKAV